VLSSCGVEGLFLWVRWNCKKNTADHNISDSFDEMRMFLCHTHSTVQFAMGVCVRVLTVRHVDKPVCVCVCVLTVRHVDKPVCVCVCVDGACASRWQTCVCVCVDGACASRWQTCVCVRVLTVRHIDKPIVRREASHGITVTHAPTWLPKMDLGRTLVGPRFGQGQTKRSVDLRSGPTSGLTSDVPPYQGFKEGLTSGQTWLSVCVIRLFFEVRPRVQRRSDLGVRSQYRSDLRLDLGLTSVRHWSDIRFDLLASFVWSAYLVNSADLGANLHNSVCYEQSLSEDFGWHRNNTFSRISRWPDTTRFWLVIIFIFFELLHHPIVSPDRNPRWVHIFWNLWLVVLKNTWTVVYFTSSFFRHFIRKSFLLC
jgi:hypothetical protein